MGYNILLIECLKMDPIKRIKLEDLIIKLKEIKL